MANAIIFTDRAPRSNLEVNIEYNPAYLSFPAGAYKLASVLREQGLSVIVVPNCLSRELLPLGRPSFSGNVSHSLIVLVFMNVFTTEPSRARVKHVGVISRHGHLLSRNL